MDKNTFLSSLREELEYLGISVEDIEKYTSQFDRYFTGMNDAEIEEQIGTFDTVESIAQNIQELIFRKAQKAKGNPIPSNLPPIAAPTSAAIIVPVEEKKEKKAKEEQASLLADTFAAPPSIEVKKVESPSTSILDAEDLEEEIPLEEKPKVRTSGTVLFWTVFVLILPITIPFGLSILALFISIFALLSVLIIISVAALIGLAAGGTLLALTGIIYGITQTFTYIPAGVYEIGLGVVIAGGSMAFGILFYNFAIRLLPFTIKKVAGLFGLVFKKLREVFFLAKGECEKL